MYLAKIKEKAKLKISRIFDFVKNIYHAKRGNSHLKSKSYIQILCSTLKNIFFKFDLIFFNLFRKKHAGIVLIEAAVTLPVMMYILLFCLELVKIHLLQIAIDKICTECVYHLCRESNVGSFESIFKKHIPSYIPVGYMRYWCRIYTSLDKMMSQSPYGGERIVFPNYKIADDICLTSDCSVGIGSDGEFIPHRKYGTGGYPPTNVSPVDAQPMMKNGIPKSYAFVLTVIARYKFSSAFVEKLFNGGSNTTKAGYYILWSRGAGIVN